MIVCLIFMFFRPQSPSCVIASSHPLFLSSPLIKYDVDESLLHHDSNANRLLLTIGLNVVWHRDPDEHSVQLRGETDYKTGTCEINTLLQQQPLAAVQNTCRDRVTLRSCGRPAETETSLQHRHPWRLHCDTGTCKPSDATRESSPCNALGRTSAGPTAVCTL